MGAIAYALCAAAALSCAVLLLRAYARSGTRLLLWSGVCFSFLTASNALIAVDLLTLPDVGLFWLRNLLSLAGVSCMLWGLIWDSK